MKECWINVYRKDTEQWQGMCYPDRLTLGISDGKLIYRIHVRLK